jgi:hypothetical protein
MNRTLAVIVAVATLASCSSSSPSTIANTTGPGFTAAMNLPGDTSVEAGFARDMSVHHAQAVAMAEAIRDRTTDPDLKLLATDIALGQQGQIGRMSGWLDEWGLNPTSTATPMAWIRSDNLLPGSTSSSAMGGMGGMSGTAASGTSTTMTADGRMPGMATRPQVTALGTLPIEQAEISFLQAVDNAGGQPHDIGSIGAGQDGLGHDDPGGVMRDHQLQAEITVMTDMLAKRGTTP